MQSRETDWLQAKFCTFNYQILDTSSNIICIICLHPREVKSHVLLTNKSNKLLVWEFCRIIRRIIRKKSDMTQVRCWGSQCENQQTACMRRMVMRALYLRVQRQGRLGVKATSNYKTRKKKGEWGLALPPGSVGAIKRLLGSAYTVKRPLVIACSPYSLLRSSLLILLHETFTKGLCSIPE